MIEDAASAYLPEDNSDIILSDADIEDTKIKLIVGKKSSVDAPEVSLPYG